MKEMLGPSLEMKKMYQKNGVHIRYILGRRLSRVFGRLV